MRISLLIAILLTVFSIQAENTVKQQRGVDIEIPFKTKLSKELAFSHKLKHQVSIQYLDHETETVLFQEKFNDVAIVKDQLSLLLGQGTSQKAKFAEVIKNNPKMLLSIKVNEQQLYPNIGLLSPGHSRKSAMMAAKITPSTGIEGKNSKSYELTNNVSSTQAVVLSSKPRVQSQGTHVRTNPYQANVIGPYLSQPLSSLPIAVQQPIQPYEVNKIRHENMFDKNGKRFGTQTDKVVDQLAYNQVSSLQGGNPPALGVNFEGMGNLSGVAPPDTEGAVGLNHFVQMVNSKLAVYSKVDGSVIQAPVDINALWAGFGGACQTDNSGDPIALYDEQADRFVLTQFAVANGNQSVCFAVSTTGDPTGTFNLYELQAQRFPDYFKVGVWPATNNNMYTLTTNSGFQNQYDVYVLDRANMIAGNAAQPAQFFQNYPNLLMPADNDGAPPTADSPALFYTFRDGGEAYFSNPPTDSLDVYEYNVDWNTPANSTLTLSQSITPADGGLTDFNWTVCGFFQSDCLPQPAPGVLIDSGSWWPQQRFQYRNFGTYETLVGTWTVDVDPAGDRAAPRWFELQRAFGDTDWVIFQEGTFSPDTTHRFSPSIAMDASGNIGLAYSVTSDSIEPSIRYTVHDVTVTPLGTMLPELEMKTGTGVETSVNRWGDYASMDVDPADGCTFWFTSEYIESNGGFNWSTYVGSFKVANCLNTSISVDTASIQVCNNENSADYTLTLSEDFVGTTNMSFTDCPANGTCGFSDNPIVAPDLNTVFSVTDLNSIAAGNYNMSATATDSVDSQLTADVGLNLDVQEPIVAAPNLLLPANGAYSDTLTPMLVWDDASGGTDFLIEVDDDPAFGSVDFSGVTSNGILDIDSTPLNQETCYYWRVAPSNACGLGNISVINQFYTGLLSDSGDLMSADVPVPISDSGTPTITSDLVVAGVGVLSDVNVKNLTITHTWISDLTIELTSPAGTTVTVITPACGSQDDMDLNLDDEAAPGAIPCPPIGGGTYQPASPLAAFDGEDADGTWTLTVLDGFNADGGSLDTWGLQFTTTNDTGNVCAADIPPTAVTDNLTVDEDSVNSSLNVLLNDTDPDGGLIDIIAVTQGDNGGVVVNNNTDVSYTPVADFCGIETFTYTLNGNSVGNVEVDVACVNDEPSMLVNSAVYIGVDEIIMPPSQNLACQFDFGPDNEDLSQSVLDMVVTVQSDVNSILNSIDVDNNGALSYTFTGNTGIAEVTVALQDDGTTNNGGDDTSSEYTFTVNVQDYIFRNDFDLEVCQ